MKPETMMIDEVKYVREDAIKDIAQDVDGMVCVLIRAYGAGVFMGYLKEQKSELNGINVVLVNSRRIHYWDGACSLSQIAVDGSKNIENCRIAMVVTEEFVANVIEIIPVTEKSKTNILGAEIWKQ